jgi:ribosomal protein L21
VYAVIELVGKQHRVASGDTVFIDGTLEGKLTPRILMVADGKNVVTDAAALGKATVEATCEGPSRIRMDRVMKFKPKQGGSSKRTIGHRRNMTRVKIGSIKLA